MEWSNDVAWRMTTTARWGAALNCVVARLSGEWNIRTRYRDELELIKLNYLQYENWRTTLLSLVAALEQNICIKRVHICSRRFVCCLVVCVVEHISSTILCCLTLTT